MKVIRRILEKATHKPAGHDILSGKRMSYLVQTNKSPCLQTSSASLPIHHSSFLSPHHVTTKSRFHSTTTTPSSTSSQYDDMDTRRMQEKARKLVRETPVGDFSVECWLEAEDLFYWWSTKGTVQSVRISLLLLERLVAEQHALLQQQQQQQDTSISSSSSSTGSSNVDDGDDDSQIRLASFLDMSLVQTLVSQWHYVYKNTMSPTNSTVATATIPPKLNFISPQQLVTQLDELCQISPTLRVGGLSLSLVLNAALLECKQTESISVANFAETIWERMVAMCVTTTRNNNNYRYNNNYITRGFRASVTNLNAALSCWNVCARPERAQAILERLDPQVVSPNQRSYNILLAAFAKTGNGQAAEYLLDDMCQQWQLQQQQQQQRRERQQAEHVAAAAAAADDDDAKDLFSLSNEQNHQMQHHGYGHEYTDDDGDDNDNEDESDMMVVRPDVISWNTAISAWAKSDDPDAAHRAQALLSRMYDPHTVPPVKPDLKTLNTVMACWSRSKKPDVPERCHRFLQEMKDLYVAGELNDPPDVFSYSTVLNAYAKAGQPDKAEELFIEMYRGFMHEGHRHLQPSLTILTSLLEAWARAGRVHKAQETFERIRELHQLGFLPNEPDVTAYNILLGCLFYCFQAVPDTAAVTADKLLEQMKEHPNLQPDSRSYSFAIQTWLKTPGGADRAIELAREVMKERDVFSMNQQITDFAAMKAIVLSFCRLGYPEYGQEMTMFVRDLARQGRTWPPDIAMFGSVVAAWKKSSDPNAALRANDVFETMKELYATGLVQDEPDALLYRTVISCWADSPLDGSALRALALLKDLRNRCFARREKLDMSIQDVNRVLSALARAKLPLEAEGLLQQTRRDHRQKKATFRANAESYNIVLRAWTGDIPPKPVERVSSILNEQKDDWKAKCSTESYNCVLQCWANSKRDEAPNRIKSLLEEMKTRTIDGVEDVKPNATSYGWLAKAYADRGEPAEAELVLKEMWNKFIEGDMNMKPEKRHFDWVEEAWAASTTSDMQEAELFRSFRQMAAQHEMDSAEC